MSQNDKHWQPQFPHTVVYQIFTRSFADGNGDGKGDIKGIRNKLPYLKELGIGAIWLTPVYESPTYHKYDVINYYAIDKECGTAADLKELVKEAHALNIKIILDFVANHTSIAHEWFKEAVKGNQTYKNYYNWSTDTVEWNKEPDHWHWVDDNLQGPEKYYGMFWRGMPDLNYDNPSVRDEIIKAASYWIREYNIDGYRLDAASHIYPYTSRKKNHEWWEQFSKAVRLIKPDLYLVGEMWGGDTLIAPYLKAGFNAGFNFDLWFNIKASLTQEEDLITAKLFKAYEKYDSANSNFCDAIMLSNHDNPRIMDEVKGNNAKAKLAAAILFTLPYTPYIYYGDELGMYGPKPDEHIREPFLWGAKDTAQCKWEPNFHNGNTKTLSEQMADTNSIYNVYKKLIQLRNSDKVLTDGEITPSPTSREGLLMYLRQLPGKNYLIIHNLKGVELEFELDSIPVYTKLKGVFEINNLSRKQDNKIFIKPYSSVVIRY